MTLERRSTLGGLTGLLVLVTMCLASFSESGDLEHQEHLVVSLPVVDIGDHVQLHALPYVGPRHQSLWRGPCHGRDHRGGDQVG